MARLTEGKLIDKIKKKISFVRSVLVVLILVGALPVILFLTKHQQDVRQHAAPGDATATISASPSSGTFTTGQSFSVSVVISAQETFNAAEATVALSPNLVIDSLTETASGSGGCNFTYVNQASTPSAANPSFAGAILNGSSASCTLYTMSLHATSTGQASVTISSGSVKSYITSTEIFLSSQNGSYTITSGVTPTPTSTPAPNTAIMAVVPPSQNVTVGQTVSVDVFEDSGSNLVNAIQFTLLYPSSLLTQNTITYGSAFSFQVFETINPGSTLIARGTLTPVSGSNRIATVTFQATAAGTANVTISGAQIISSVDPFPDIFASATNGVINIATVAPTATPTTIPTNSPTPTRTPTPVPPSTTPTSGPTPTAGGPTLTPTPIFVQVPTINAPRAKTYKTSMTISGTKTSSVSLVFVNGSSTGVTYPISTTWSFVANLNLGINTFSVLGQDALGNRSVTSTSVSVDQHRLGDIDGDRIIDIIDLSLFGPDWKKTGNFNNILSDMNEDGTIDLTDFSILARAYGN